MYKVQKPRDSDCILGVRLVKKENDLPSTRVGSVKNNLTLITVQQSEHLQKDGTALKTRPPNFGREIHFPSSFITRT
jgi:hypothetical protein